MLNTYKKLIRKKARNPFSLLALSIEKTLLNLNRKLIEQRLLKSSYLFIRLTPNLIKSSGVAIDVKPIMNTLSKHYALIPFLWKNFKSFK